MIQIIKSDINEYDQMLKDITNSHDIKFLFQKYEDNFTEIKSNHYYEFIKTTIIDINTYDRNSQCLRYAVDKNYKVDKKPRKIFREINWDDDKGLKILHNSILGSEFKNYEVENQDLLDMINNGYLTFICLRMYNEYWNQ